MAKVTKKTAKSEKPKAKAKENPLTAEAPKFGIAELAKELNSEPSAVRARLRNSDLKKNGARWGWDTKKDFDAAVKALKSSGKTEEKPAKKSTKKK